MGKSPISERHPMTYAGRQETKFYTLQLLGECVLIKNHFGSTESLFTFAS